LSSLFRAVFLLFSVWPSFFLFDLIPRFVPAVCRLLLSLSFVRRGSVLLCWPDLVLFVFRFVARIDHSTLLFISVASFSSILGWAWTQ
jgi:hypothetical protein